MTAILLTQVSACLRIPQEARAELEPDVSPRNHFADEAAGRPKSADEINNPQ